jgi:hypothetical protein
VLDEEELEDLFNRAGAKGRQTLTLDGFETLLDLLSPLTDDIDEEEDLATIEGMQRGSGTGAEAEEDDDESLGAGAGAGQLLEAEEDVDEEALLHKVFQSLSHGKPRATVKDLLAWDFVLELMGGGLLTEELLADKMVAAGGTSKGVEVQHFDLFVDSLVDLYGEEEESEEEAAAFDGRVGTSSSASASAKASGSEGEGEGEGEEHDDFEYDVDIDTAFQELAGSQAEDATLTMGQLMQWELLQSVSTCDDVAL